ncbi:MAG: HD domain-containing protein [Chitinophagaceae bacterium]|nr:MAG: HD domain-containing protein [Chitinophagaceae bacterium]
MKDQELISNTIVFVKATLAGAEAGHDWFHIERVFKTALTINSAENGDETIVALAALLHDIADPKFNGGDETAGPAIAGDFLSSNGASEEMIHHVQQIIRYMSFKNSFDKNAFSSLELRIVQDADRLDAIGAIGIARAFTYGGFKNRLLYDPEIPPVTFGSKEAYKKADGPTINHFYEKLLLLKDKMNTGKGRELANERHVFMEQFLKQFYGEWNGEK